MQLSIAACIACLVAGLRATEAQIIVDATPVSAQACDSLVRSSTSRGGASGLSRLERCGAAGHRALASVVRSLASMRDSARISDIAKLISDSDPEVVSAAADVARDSSAVPQVRISALIMMARQLYGGSPAIMQGGLGGDECSIMILEGHAAGPPASVNIVKAATESIAVDATTPHAVRAIARCFRNRFAPRLSPAVKPGDTTVDAHQSGTVGLFTRSELASVGLIDDAA